jgi:amino acid transporter
MAAIEPGLPATSGYGQQPMTEKGRAVQNLVEADLLDDRYATTQRGLKSRHVQLMALGGTIGTGEIQPTTTNRPNSDRL